MSVPKGISVPNIVTCFLSWNQTDAIPSRLARAAPPLRGLRP
jgi:hypothetical protein